MKIGIDARNITDKNSGLVNYVKNLTINILEKDRENNFILFINKKYFQYVCDLFSEYKNIELVSTYYDNDFLSLNNLIFEQKSFGNIINKHNLDIFHNPFGFGIPNNLKANSIILTIHDLIPLTDYDELSLMQKLIYRISLGISIKKSSKIICISQFTKNELLKIFPNVSNKKTLVIYDGYDNLDLSDSNPDDYSKFKSRFNIDSKYIFYIGSATKRKNLINLVKAFVILKKQHNIAEKLVISSKFDREITKKTLNELSNFLNRENMESDVIFTGYLSDIEKGISLKNCEIFVYPSIYEGFGLPILEAMAFDKPIICSDIPPFKEICGDAAEYFNPLDCESMASVIFKVIGDKERMDVLSKKSHERKDAFSWKIMVKEYLKLYMNK